MLKKRSNLGFGFNFFYKLRVGLPKKLQIKGLQITVRICFYENRFKLYRVKYDKNIKKIKNLRF